MSKREFFRKTMILASLALGTLPAALLAFAWMCPQWLWLAPVYAGCFLMLGAVWLWVPGKRRLLLALPVTVLLGILCLASFGEKLLPVMAFWGLYSGLFLWSLQLGSWEPDDELSPLVPLGCLALHLLGQFALFADSRYPQPKLTLCGPWLTGSFLGFLLLTVLAWNRGSMYMASGAKRSVTQSVRTKNSRMMLILFGAAIAASFIPKIYEWIRQGILWIIAGVLRLLTALLPEMGGAGPGGEGASPGGLPPVEDTEPSLFMKILETVMVVLVCLAMLALSIWLLWQLIRLVRNLLRQLWTALGRYAAAVSEDYVDEITSTRGAGEERSTRRNPGRKKPKRLRDGTPEETVRYRYRLLLWKNPQWIPGATARENLPATAAEIYEQARYSTHPVTREDAERFQKEIQKEHTS